MRSSHDKDTKNKEAELATLKGKIKVLEQSSGAGVKRIAELKQEHEEASKSKKYSLGWESYSLQYGRILFQGISYEEIEKISLSHISLDDILSII